MPSSTEPAELLIAILAAVTLVLFIGKSIIFVYNKYKYKTCPKCGSLTITCDKEEYTFADTQTVNFVSCTNDECTFTHKYNKFLD